jgi:hypothetical protein
MVSTARVWVIVGVGERIWIASGCSRAMLRGVV